MNKITYNPVPGGDVCAEIDGEDYTVPWEDGLCTFLVTDESLKGAYLAVLPEETATPPGIYKLVPTRTEIERTDEMYELPLDEGEEEDDGGVEVPIA